jgi:hypothetical protein
MSKRKTTPARVVVDLKEAKPRKKKLPRTAFQKGNTMGFQKGVCPSPGGKPHGERRLLSKALNVFLSDRAPEEGAKQLGLPPNPPGSTRYIYSWAQILAKRILNLAVKGEAWAVSEVSRLTEPVHARIGFGGFYDEEGTGEAPPAFELVMVSSDGEGHISKESLATFPELAGNTIEGHTAPALPAPED